MTFEIIGYKFIEADDIEDAYEKLANDLKYYIELSEKLLEEKDE